MACPTHTTWGASHNKRLLIQVLASFWVRTLQNDLSDQYYQCIGLSWGSGEVIWRLLVQFQDVCALTLNRSTSWCCVFGVFVYSTAKEVEAIVRKEGAIPATVGVVEGEVRVGLTLEELDHLAQCRSSVKVSRRDLPYVLSKVWHTLSCNTNLRISYFHQSSRGSNTLLWFCRAFPAVRRCLPRW